jgi:hypothetical protein
MRKITLFAVAAAVIATGFGVWAAAPTSARISPSRSQGIEPLQIMAACASASTARPTDNAGLQADPRESRCADRQQGARVRVEDGKLDLSKVPAK